MSRAVLLFFIASGVYQQDHSPALIWRPQLVHHCPAVSRSIILGFPLPQSSSAPSLSCAVLGGFVGFVCLFPLVLLILDSQRADVFLVHLLCNSFS